MHFAAAILGILIHVWGDLFVCYAALIVWRGKSAFSPDILQNLPARPVLAIELFPVPALLSLGGAALVYWGLV
jgi:hypothetical protein